MIQLTNKAGERIPLIGLGTFPFQGRELTSMVKDAFHIGYRLFDTSDDYRGQPGIGMAVEEMTRVGIPRERLFLQTKVSDICSHEDEPLKGIYFNPTSSLMKRHSVDEIVREKVDTSLRELRTTYLDSLLFHLPYPNYFIDIWRVMVELKKEGKVRYIGVSNCRERHIQMLIDKTGVAPEINQIYISPIGNKRGLVDYCHSISCLVMTYSPLMDVARQRIPIEPIRPLMEKYGKSIAQIVLRWNIQRGCLPLPRTKSIMRLKENFEVFDFELEKEDMEMIKALNYDYQYLVESKICPGL